MGVRIFPNKRIRLNVFFNGQLASVTVVTSKHVINEVYPVYWSMARVEMNNWA